MAEINSHIVAVLSVTFFLAINAVGASANVSDRVVLHAPKIIIAKKIPSLPGVTKLLVATNTPYVIKSEGAVGEFNISFKSQGTIDGVSFGSRSQIPTRKARCIYVDQPWETSLFASEYRTASGSGRPIDQAIIVEVTYDSRIAPRLYVEPVDSAATNLLPLGCNSN